MLRITLLSLGSLFALPACSITWEAPDVLVEVYPDAARFDTVVELRMDDDYRNTTWRYENGMGDSFSIPLGEALANNAESMTKELFRGVVIRAGGDDSVVGESPSAVLIPRVVGLERSMGSTAFGNSYFTIQLEWRLEDLQGNLFWVETVKGKSVINSGNLFTAGSNAKEQTGEVIQRLFRTSFDAISNHPALHRRWSQA